MTDKIIRFLISFFFMRITLPLICSMLTVSILRDLFPLGLDLYFKMNTYKQYIIENIDILFYLFIGYAFIFHVIFVFIKRTTKSFIESNINNKDESFLLEVETSAKIKLESYKLMTLIIPPILSNETIIDKLPESKILDLVSMTNTYGICVVIVFVLLSIYVSPFFVLLSVYFALNTLIAIKHNKKALILLDNEILLKNIE